MLDWLVWLAGGLIYTSVVFSAGFLAGAVWCDQARRRRQDEDEWAEHAARDRGVTAKETA